MAKFTSMAIREAFMELLQERPLADITVRDIAEKSGVNRNTFYYHYQDIPAVLEEIIKQDSQMIINKYPSVNSIVECFDALIEFASHRKGQIMHIFRSVNREVFERNLMVVTEHFVRSYVNTAIDGISISEADKKTIVTYYKSVCFGLVIEWLECEMSEEYATEIRKIFSLKKDFAKEIALRLQDQV